MAELWQEIHRAETVLIDERAEKTTLLDEAAREQMELHKQHYEEKEILSDNDIAMCAKHLPKSIVALQGVGGGYGETDRAIEE